MKKHFIYNIDDSRSLVDPKPLTIKALHTTTVQQLGEAFYSAYLNTIDYEGETVEQAVAEVEKVLTGGYGPVIEAASGYLTINGVVAAAVFVTDRGSRAFIPYIFTRSKCKNRGLARQLLINAINKLKHTEYNQIELYVTSGNVYAEQLYQGIGFVTVP